MNVVSILVAVDSVFEVERPDTAAILFLSVSILVAVDSVFEEAQKILLQIHNPVSILVAVDSVFEANRI